MSTYSDVEATTTPEHIITLPPSAFADDYVHKPSADVAIGLRRLSQNDIEAARQEAEKEAVGFYEDLDGHIRRPDLPTVVDVRNDALMCIAVGRACVDPNDVTKLYFRGQEDTVRVALTPEGVRRIYDEYVLFTAGSGIAKPRATDVEARVIGLALARGGVPLDDEARVLLAYLAESLGIDDALDDDDLDLEAEPDERAVYFANAAPTP